MVLLDTCALLWWTLDPDHLSDEAKKVCNRIDNEGAFISSISIWEIGIKLKKGVINIGEDLRGYVHRLKQLGSLEIIAVDEMIWIKNLQLEWDHKDPCDRTIVATAILNKLPIVTKDSIIAHFYSNVIW
jgi:PIN domain nuclease of toxin-antitoxin system